MFVIERQDNIVLLKDDNNILSIYPGSEDNLVWRLKTSESFKDAPMFLIPKEEEVYEPFEELNYYLNQEGNSKVYMDNETKWEIIPFNQGYAIKIASEKEIDKPYIEAQTPFSLPFIFLFWRLQMHYEEPYEQVSMEEYIYQKSKKS